MPDKDILDLVYGSIDEINRLLPADRRLEKSLDTALLGEGSELDSLSLINFIVAFEEALEQALGVRCNLLEEECLTDPTGPLKSIGSLVDFVAHSRG